MKLQLPSSVSSQQDLQALVLEIREYARWWAHATIKKQLHTRHAAAEPPVLSPAASELLHSWESKQELNRNNLDTLIRELQQFQAKAPTLTITLAAPPAAGLKKSLVSWCRENIAADVLVQFEFNSTLLGGMVVRYGSRIFDWSFRRQILANRQHFPEVLRHV